MSKKPKLFAWDFHGTLEHGTDVGFYNILKILRSEFKIPTKIGLSEVRRMFGASVTEYLEHFFPKLDDEIYDLMRTRIANVESQEQILKRVKAAPYSRTVLKKISNLGHKNIVVTNSHPRHIEYFMQATKLSGMFDEIFAVDRHYSKAKYDTVGQKAKSIKDFSRKNALEEIIVIGDRGTDIEAGYRVGAITIQYIRKGFPEIKTRAHHKITDLREILKHT